TPPGLAFTKRAVGQSSRSGRVRDRSTRPTEIGFDDARVGKDGVAIARYRNRARFEYVGAITDFQTEPGHLLDDQQRDALPAQVDEGIKDRLEHERREPERRFVE